MDREWQTLYEKWATRIRAEQGGENVHPKHASRYLELYKARTNYDRRYFYFDVHAEEKNGRVELTGEVQYSEQIGGLVSLLNTLGLEVENKVSLVTEGLLGDSCYAIVNTYASCAYVEPSSETELVTQSRFGERIQILTEPRSGFCLVRSNDGYLGWVETSSFIRCGKDRWLAWENCPRVRFLQPSTVGSFSVPAGTELPLRESSGRVELPDSTMVSLLEEPGAEAPYEEITALGNSPIRHRIIQIAKSWQGTRYFWGGKTHQGTDCSGFVQSIYALCGVFIPRDAMHQFLIGRLCGSRDFMQPLQGDLLFFLNRLGSVSHVAISLGGQRFIHSGNGRVHIASMDPKDEDFQDRYASIFVCAKRVLAE